MILLVFIPFASGNWIITVEASLLFNSAVIFNLWNFKKHFSTDHIGGNTKNTLNNTKDTVWIQTGIFFSFKNFILKIL